MNNTLIRCPKCQAWLMEGVFNQPGVAPCPACGVPLQIEVFPALFREIAAGRSGETILVEGESSCFYHLQKKAVRTCDGCGRFLCALCDCTVDEGHFCPTCLEAGAAKGKIKSLENQRTLYDSIALGLAVYPILIFYFTLLTAPMALFVAIRYWNAPLSILHRTRIRAIAAIVISLLLIAGWITLFIFIATRHNSHV